MSNTSSIFAAFSVLVGVLVCGIWSNIHAYAQQQSFSTPSSSSASTPSSRLVPKVKITSPTKGQQVPIGKDLTISGTSIGNATSSNNDCKVSIIVNKVRPYQPAAATGTGGAADYSKWKFDITSKYTTIKPGANRITAKYDCEDNPASSSFSSVNVTGVQQQGTGAATTTTTTTARTGTAAAAAGTSARPAISKSTTTATTAEKTPLSSSQTPLQTTTSSTTSVGNVAGRPSSIFAIAPQVKAVNQQLQPGSSIHDNSGSKVQGSDFDPKPSITPHTRITVTDNDSAGKKMTDSTKLVRTHTTYDSSSKHNSDSATKSSSSHDKSSTAADNGSTGKTTTTKSDIAPTTNDDSTSKKGKRSHSDDAGHSSSIIENDIPSVILKSFNFKHSTDSDISKSSSIIENDIPSVILKSFNFK
jgi:hypothetical protein